jgi:hypothetical protein
MNTTQLERECCTYTRYLIGQAPTKYVIERYIDFHRKSEATVALEFERFDNFLVGVSALQPFWARMVDTYASVLRKNSAVRKKLVLTLAILECTPPSFEELDRVDSRSSLGTSINLAWGAMKYALTLMTSVVAFTPVRLVMNLCWKLRPEAVLER